jgi:RNA polymerase-binding transcription factor DksA
MPAVIPTALLRTRGARPNASSADAQQHAEQLVAEHVITQRAQQMAEQTNQEAVREAEEMRAQADSYAYDVLGPGRHRCCSVCPKALIRAKSRSARPTKRLPTSHGSIVD